MSSELGVEQIGRRDLLLLGKGLWTADVHGFLGGRVVAAVPQWDLLAVIEHAEIRVG